MRKKIIFKILSCLFIASFFLVIVFAYKQLLPRPDSEKQQTSITILTYKNIPLSTLDGFHTQYPDYEINIERYPRQNYLTFVDTKLTQEDSVDIIELPAEAYAEYIEKDLLLPLTSMPLFTRIRSEALDYIQKTGKTSTYYGVPYQSNYLGVWYNVSLFEKYNLSPPDNLENFLTACKVFSKEGISPLAVGLADDEASNNLLTLLTADSFSSVSVPSNTYTDFAGIDNVSHLRSFQTCYNMLTQDYLPDSCFYMTDEQAFEAFLNSSYAMAVSPESSIAMINDSVLQQIDMDVCGFHITSEQNNASVVGNPVSSLLCISKSSENTQICKLFLDYYTKYDTVLQYVNDTRTMTNIQNYTVNSELSMSWSDIKEENYYVPEEHFYISAFGSDTEIYSLPRKLFYNLITAEEFINELSS